jgi:general secretion pathway protein G
VNGRSKGFTLIEMMVVMAMIAALVAIAVPRYFDGLQRTKETALKQNLKEMRDAIDDYHADKGVYPQSLTALVEERYLRFIPVDPITEQADTWQIVAPPQSGIAGQDGYVYDVLSGSAEKASNGELYNTW